MDPQGEKHMKLAVTIGVAVVMPFGLVILGGVLASHFIAKCRRQHRSDGGGSAAATILA
jgi:hypothetical protein